MASKKEEKKGRENTIVWNKTHSFSGTEDCLIYSTLLNSKWTTLWFACTLVLWLSSFTLLKLVHFVLKNNKMVALSIC